MEKIKNKIVRDGLYMDCPICKAEGIIEGVCCDECDGTGKVLKPIEKFPFKKTLL